MPHDGILFWSLNSICRRNQCLPGLGRNMRTDVKQGLQEFLRMMEIPGPGRSRMPWDNYVLAVVMITWVHTVSQMHQVIHLKWVHLKKIIFIYFWLCWVFVWAVWAFSSCCEQGLLSSCRTQPSHCSGFSSCRAKALATWVSVARGTWA